MDLGCLDLGCISVSDKQGTNDDVLDSDNKENDATTTASPKIGKVSILTFRFSDSIQDCYFSISALDLFHFLESDSLFVFGS